MGRPAIHTEFADVADWRGGPYLYALELSNGVIKVGRANDARHRLVTHKTQAAARGLRIARFAVAPTQNQSALTERELIFRVAQLAELHFGFEWFVGLCWGEATNLLHQIAPRQVVEVCQRSVPGYAEWAGCRNDRWGVDSAWEYIGDGYRPRKKAKHPRLAAAQSA